MRKGYTWLRWFAWRPVKCQDGSWAWLTYVERYRWVVADWDHDGTYKYDYRKIVK